MEDPASESADISNVARTEDSVVQIAGDVKKRDLGGTFKCTYCPLEEHYDFKGGKPPFARQIKFSEDCYIMKDPMSLPNRGEVLVLGADCGLCKKSVCLGCSIFYTKRFCPKCATDCKSNLPVQLHAKISALTKDQEN